MDVEQQHVRPHRRRRRRRDLGSGPPLRSGWTPLPSQMKGVDLSCVRTCMVVAEERPRLALTQSFSKLFKDLGLPARAVSTTFGCRVNVAICLQVRGCGGLTCPRCASSCHRIRSLSSALRCFISK